MISSKLSIFVLSFAILLFLFLIKLVKDKNVSVKYALVWLIPLMVFIISILFPKFFINIAHLIGFDTLVSFVFCILFAFLIIICMVLTVIVTRLRNRQKILIQELSLLKEKVYNEKK